MASAETIVGTSISSGEIVLASASVIINNNSTCFFVCISKGFLVKFNLGSKGGNFVNASKYD